MPRDMSISFFLRKTRVFLERLQCSMKMLCNIVYLVFRLPRFLIKTMLQMLNRLLFLVVFERLVFEMEASLRAKMKTNYGYECKNAVVKKGYLNNVYLFFYSMSSFAFEFDKH